MKRWIMLVLVLLVVRPVRAEGLLVEDTVRHFSFVMPKGWVVDMPDEKAGEHFDGDFAIHPAGVKPGEFPLIHVMYEEGGFRDDPQAFMRDWKVGKPASGILLRNDIRYEPFTGRIVADKELFENGALSTHVRAVMVSGKSSKVAVMLADRAADFWTDLPVLEAVVNSVKVETAGALSAGTMGAGTANAGPGNAAGNGTEGGAGVPTVGEPAGVPAGDGPTGVATGGSSLVWWVIGGAGVLAMLGLGAAVVGVVVVMLVRGKRMEAEKKMGNGSAAGLPAMAAS